MNRHPYCELAAVVIGGLLLASCSEPPRDDPAANPVPVDGPRWTAAWAASAYDSGPLAAGSTLDVGIANQTLRNVARVSIGGSAVRLRLSNLMGAEPVTFDAVSVGIGEVGAVIVAGSLRAVTFGGRAGVTLRDGARAVSDPVDLALAPGVDVVVSLYSAGPTGRLTGHRGGGQTGFVADGGDATAEVANADQRFAGTAVAWYVLEAIDVLAPPEVQGVVVALGDSTTIGAASTIDANRRWTDVVARRLASVDGGPTVSVVNAGISGNRVLTSSACFGENAVARLERDVLAQTGVAALFLFEGTNDLGHPDGLADASARIRPCVNAPQVTAEDMVGAYQQIVALARARGLSVFGGTILPYGGYRAWTPAGEAKRETINDWILTSGAFDGTVDFAATVADADDPTRLAPPFDSGDHLHPSDAGYAAMGEAVDLAMFSRLVRR